MKRGGILAFFILRGGVYFVVFIKSFLEKVWMLDGLFYVLERIVGFGCGIDFLSIKERDKSDRLYIKNRYMKN